VSPVDELSVGTVTDNSQNVAFVAKRVGFQVHPEWGVPLDQLWLK
jgi:hypothetical protein